MFVRAKEINLLNGLLPFHGGDVLCFDALTSVAVRHLMQCSFPIPHVRCVVPSLGLQHVLQALTLQTFVVLDSAPVPRRKAFWCEKLVIGWTHLRIIAICFDNINEKKLGVLVHRVFQICAADLGKTKKVLSVQVTELLLSVCVILLSLSIVQNVCFVT